jgi:hypothetical protein
MLPNYWHEVIERAEGPMRIRLILQPIAAALFAIRAGRRDARGGRRPYLWAVVWARSNRKEMILHGWRDVGRVFVLAIGIDLIYQATVLHAFRPGEAVFLGILLAIVPYLIFRGVVNRILRRREESSGTAI